jgi:hypothetical protein
MKGDFGPGTKGRNLNARSIEHLHRRKLVDREDATAGNERVLLMARASSIPPRSHKTID